jgi:hypothetical protein
VPADSQNVPVLFPASLDSSYIVDSFIPALFPQDFEHAPREIDRGYALYFSCQRDGKGSSPAGHVEYAPVRLDRHQIEEGLCISCARCIGGKCRGPLVPECGSVTGGQWCCDTEGFAFFTTGLCSFHSFLPVRPHFLLSKTCQVSETWQVCLASRSPRDSERYLSSLRKGGPPEGGVTGGQSQFPRRKEIIVAGVLRTWR